MLCDHHNVNQFKLVQTGAAIATAGLYAVIEQWNFDDQLGNNRFFEATNQTNVNKPAHGFLMAMFRLVGEKS